jgi:hypothetical protein
MKRDPLGGRPIEQITFGDERPFSDQQLWALERERARQRESRAGQRYADDPRLEVLQD